MTEQLPLAAFPDCHGCRNFRSGPAQVCLGCATRKLTRPGAGSCAVCAQRLAASGACPNELCRSPRRRISRIHAIGYQSGPLRRVINEYKYRGARDWSAVFGRLLAAWLEENHGRRPARPHRCQPQLCRGRRAAVCAYRSRPARGRWGRSQGPLAVRHRHPRRDRQDRANAEVRRCAGLVQASRPARSCGPHSR